MKKITLLVAAALSVVSFARADITNWYATTTGTANNVVAATSGSGGGQTGANGGGWVFSGTGITFDYGALNVGLNSAGTNTGNNAFGASYGTIQYIFNLSTTGPSIALGTPKGYNNSENYVLKLEQYNNTGAFGATVPGIGDYRFTSDGTGTGTNVASVFNTTVMATFVLDANRWSLYLNDTLVGTDTRGAAWRIWGGTGTLGSGSTLPTDGANGQIFGVATYNRALTSSEIAANYASFAAVPEPSAYGLLGAGALASAAFLRRRRKVA